MATYRGIKGFTIQSLSSDPAADANTEGQVWYNTTSNTLKGVTAVSGVGAWSSGNSLPVARRNEGGIGTQTAALAVMGTPPSSYPGVTTNCETYDGTNWTGAPATNAARTNMGSCQIGTQTAGQVQGGYTPGPTGNTATEGFNGVSWTVKTGMSSGRWMGTGGGITTAGFYVGGTLTGGSNTGIMEEYNGSTWTEKSDLNNARRYLAGGGTTTAGLAFMGGPPGATYGMYTESWNGAAWTNESALNGARQYAAGIVGPAAQTSAVAVGGQTSPTFPSTGGVETWDGSSWTVAASLGTGRSQMAGVSAASTTAGLVSGGGPYTAVTEEWNVASPSIAVKTFTSS